MRDRAKIQFPEFEKAIGAGILATRQARGIDRRSFAKAIGITYQQVQKYETGRNRIPVSRFLDMSRALGVEPANGQHRGIRRAVEQKRNRAR